MFFLTHIGQMLCIKNEFITTSAIHFFKLRLYDKEFERLETA